MKKTLAKILALALCAVLLVTGTVFVTLAYLQSYTGVVKNTFTAGKVKIKLDEAKVDEHGVAAVDGSRIEPALDGSNGNNYKIVPDTSYVKDPTVTVERGSEPCYVIIAIKDDLFKKYYEAPSKDGGDGFGTSRLEVPYSYDGTKIGTIYDQIKAYCWQELTPSNVGPQIALTNYAYTALGNNCVLYYYCPSSGPVVKAEPDNDLELPIFRGFQLKDVIDEDIITWINTGNSGGTTLQIMAFAVQTNFSSTVNPYQADVDNVIAAFNAAFTVADSGEEPG